VPAKEGDRRSGLSAAGGGVLERCSGAFAGGGLVWCRGEQVRAAAAAVPSPRHGRGQSEQKGQRGMDAGGLQSPRDKPVPLLRTASLQSFPTLPLQDSALKVFDEMPGRSQNSNFRNFQIGLVIIGWGCQIDFS
jgi:hypothetical protein